MCRSTWTRWIPEKRRGRHAGAGRIGRIGKRTWRWKYLCDCDKMRGMEIVEVNPVLDVANQTAILGVELVLSALGKRILENFTVAVLYGGRSGEHEISLRSAESIMNALDPRAIRVARYFISKEGQWDPRPIMPEPGGNPGDRRRVSRSAWNLWRGRHRSRTLELADLPYVGPVCSLRLRRWIRSDEAVCACKPDCLSLTTLS